MFCYIYIVDFQGYKHKWITISELCIVCTFLLQEICLENFSFSIPRGEAWGWQNETERVSLNQTPLSSTEMLLLKEVNQSCWFLCLTCPLVRMGPTVSLFLNAVYFMGHTFSAENNIFHVVFVVSYGIRNRDEVTFMKRLRKKWIWGTVYTSGQNTKYVWSDLYLLNYYLI